MQSASVGTPAVGTQLFIRSNDLRNEKGTGNNYITAIDNQGSCNACTAFAVAATVEGSYNKKNNIFGPPDKVGPDVDPWDIFFNAPTSPKDCRASHWWPEGALDYAMQTGLKRPDGTRLQISNYSNLVVPKHVDQTKNAIKDWIDNTGPVLAVMVYFEDFKTFGDNWTSANGSKANTTNVYYPGVVTGDPGAITGGHVLSIVGYNDDASGNNIPYWICKNSWDGWNGDGYVLMQQGKMSAPLESSYIEYINVWGVVI